MGFFKQVKNEAQAITVAEKESAKSKNTLTVIKSKHGGETNFYVEEGSPLVRVWETVVGVWENGIKQKL